ncbi:glycosyltransferase [Psychromonas sp. Urea-02u-13]|uniref:glycosyltransferase n=1 Tax=Psychromonas sp. Urea-02u-13 TaxID=2058326 RepID=UPI000C34D7F7|nr:glycosyltransferase [Psychromonas sp. Urea-02u-13]PKG37910.1 glycosyl transferase [Psychromonas sp. Urea-02u-13]
MHHDLIVFAEDWQGLPSSTQHLIKQLATTRKVVWINSIGLRQPTLNWQDAKRLWMKLSASHTEKNKSEKNNTITASNESASLESDHSESKHLEQANSNHDFYVVNPRTLPAPRSQFARFIARQLLLLQIKPIIKKAQLDSPLLWVSLPTAVDFSGHLGESGLVYYCGDDFSGLAGVDHNTVALREQELSEKADLILAASPKLVTHFPKHNTQLLTHGVDYKLFSTATPRANDLPDDGRPIAGFYGSISQWLDLPLLRETILKLPQWHFVFIGKAVVDISLISALENVTLLGEREHHLLPSYSQHWTASLLPFCDNAQIRACNPLKLKEYLAAGRPIISTHFPAIDAYRGLVQIANNSDAMVEALLDSQHVQSLAQFSTVLRDVVAQKSWQARANKLSHWLGEL